MTGYADAPTAVRPGPLGLRIGSTLDIVGREHLHLPGALAHVDPASPWEPPALTVLDARLAAEVLDELWGPGAVDLALADVSGELDPASAGPGLADLHGLGVARWLERWQPYPLDPGLLRLDVLVGAARCAHLLDVGELGEEDPLVLAEDAGLADLAEVEELADRVASSFPVGAEGVGSDAGATGREGGPLAAPSWAATLGRPGAVAAATPGVPVLRGVTTADWDRVPTGTVSRAESAVHWEITSGSGASGGGPSAVDGGGPPGTGGGGLSGTGAAELHVVATAAETGAPHPLARGLRPRDETEQEVQELRFRLFVPGWPLPLCEGPLAPVGTSLSWAGSVTLSPPAAERAHHAGPKELLLDVLRPGLAHPPLTGEPAQRARARRWGVRAVAAHRLAVVSGHASLSDQARSAARQAAALWSALGEPAHLEAVTRAVPDVGTTTTPWLGLAERWALVAEAGG